MQRKTNNRALILGLSVGGVAAVIAGLVTRVVLIVFGLDLLMRILGA